MAGTRVKKVTRRRTHLLNGDIFVFYCHKHVSSLTIIAKRTSATNYLPHLYSQSARILSVSTAAQITVVSKMESFKCQTERINNANRQLLGNRKSTYVYLRCIETILNTVNFKHLLRKILFIREASEHLVRILMGFNIYVLHLFMK